MWYLVDFELEALMMLDCKYQEMCELYCHFDALSLCEVWMDLYEQILAVQSSSVAPMDKFESRRSWHLTIGDRVGSQLIE